MARVAGVDLPRDKRGEVAITYIYGIGRPMARHVMARASVDPDKRVKAWTDEEVGRVREIIEERVRDLGRKYSAESAWGHFLGGMFKGKRKRR